MRRYSDEVKQFIANNVNGATTKDLAELVNRKFGLDFTESKMKAFKNNNGLKSNTRAGVTPGKPTKLYPREVMDFIADNYVGTGPKEMTALLNDKFGTDYTVEQIKCYYTNRKLNSGLTGQFKPGHVPFNKGKKGQGGWEPTQFKKGNIPVNYRPVGSERVNVYGYVEIKVADPGKWKLKHKVVWEQHHGLVPKGHAVIFGDGDKFNFYPSNLILVTRKQLLRLNQLGLIQKDADLTRVGVSIVDLYHKIAEVKK